MTLVASHLHWFFVRIGQLPTALPAMVTLDDADLVHHLKTVMRLRPGEQVVLVDEDAHQPYLARLESLAARQASITLLEGLPVPETPPVVMVAAVALLKGPKWDWVLQKLVELGVSEIIPLQTRRTVVEVKNPESKQQRWQQILKQAAEQSEQVRIPVLHPVMTPKDLIETIPADDTTLRLVAMERSGVSLSEKLQSCSSTGRMVFAVGPEGGWDPAEQDLLHAGGFQPVSLGDKILRSETAAIYLASVIHYVIHSQSH